MNTADRPVNLHKAYHAHVYFDQETVEFAAELCLQVGQLFSLKIGRVHRKPVGPHPKWSCQIVFGSKDFDTFIPWLDQHRNGLTVLVHALSGDDLRDHTEYAYWLGDCARLDLSVFAGRQ